MRKIIYLKHKPTKQTCALVETDIDGRHPITVTKQIMLSRFFVDYVIEHSLEVRGEDFEIGEKNVEEVGDKSAPLQPGG